MPFAKSEGSARYLTQQLSMPSKNAVNSDRNLRTLQKAVEWTQFPTGEKLSLIIAFTPMPFAKFENPIAIYSVFWWHDQLLCQIAIGFFKLCKRHWSERNNHAELFARWILRSLQCLLQSSKNPLAIYSVFWWHDQLLCQIAIGFFKLCKRHWSERNIHLANSSAWLLRSVPCLLQSSKIRSLFYSVFWW